jgi:metal-responsive CopG/Arc/MetJ family transcriptional regulator
MGELARPVRMQIMLDAEELRALDDWRFKSRMPSRASAIRELLRRGLVAEGFEAAIAGQSSSRFGVLSEQGGQD